jgi:hypothetical protein
VELPRPSVEEHGERVVARREKDADDLVAGEQLPVQMALLGRGHSPADLEFVDAHDGGENG